MKPVRRLPVSLALYFGLLLVAYASDPKVTVQKWRLTSGTALHVELDNQQVLVATRNDQRTPDRTLVRVQLNSEDWSTLVKSIRTCFSDEMFGQRRQGGKLGGARFSFFVDDGAQGGEPKTFELRNVRFAELDACMTLLDSYLPDKYRLFYATEFGPAVPIQQAK